MVNVLFVCLGNICRSPAAEGVFQKIIDEKKLHDQVTCDSAGTSAYHSGEPADGRMSEKARERGYLLTSISRQFIESDLKNFDYILVMDSSNYSDVKAIDYRGEYLDRVHQFTDFCTIHDINAVPDPYYGNGDGFSLVMDIIEDGCNGFLDHLIKKEQVDIK